MNIALVSFIIAIGFVVSAIIHTVDRTIHGKNGGTTISFHSLRHFLFGFVFFMFVGPYVVLERGVTFWRFGGISFPVFAFSCAIALLWSFCSGIFVTQILMIAGVLSSTA